MNQKAADEQERAQLLPKGALLHRRYIVDDVLGRGAYGVTYLGHDEKTGTQLAIREYFPRALAVRTEEGATLSPKSKQSGGLFFLGSEMFYQQHLALTNAKGSENAVTVYDAFFENGTSYAAMDRLEGVTLERFLQLRRRRLTPEEAMYIAASLADALLVVHSLNTLHYDISARTIFLCTDGTVKLIDFGAAKAGLRARREVDDAEPWIDLAAMANTLYEALTGRSANDGAIRPDANVPQALADLFRRMLDKEGQRRISSVFEYRHALACVEVGAVCPDVTLQDVHSTLPPPARSSAQSRSSDDFAPEQQKEQTPRRTLFDHMIEAVENATPSEARSTPKQAQRGKHLRRRIALIYGGIAVGTLIIALIIRALTR